MTRFLHEHDKKLRTLCALIVFSLWVWSVAAQTPVAVDTATGVQDAFFYPNPAKDFLIISMPATITILDIVGHEVFRKTTVAWKEKVDISAIPDGVYFVEIAGKTKRLKIARS